MKEMLRELLTSKKFATTVVAIIVWVVGRFGLHVDEAALLPLVGALAAFVVAQGLADQGKSAAKIDAQAAAAERAPTNPEP